MVLSSFLITSRETLEVALVVGIVLAYLIKTDNHRYKKAVYYGIAVGIVLSILAAVIFTSLAGGFEGKTEEIFEGITMLVAAGLLTTMILWMMKQKQVVKELENKVSVQLKKEGFNKKYGYGIFLLIVVAVLREGVETIIFLHALNFTSGVSFLGGILGVAAAIVIGYLFFIGAKKIYLKEFFVISGILLILFAAGLVAHGVHGLQEAAVIPYVVKEVWDVNPAVAVENVYPALHEKGAVGGFFKGLFGYNGNPSLLEILFYVAYLIGIFLVYRKVEGKNSVKE
ncbi:high-affinity iron transporter [Candidatus Woesearchaeota archaeon]|jgi:high-affinity iron transporter|nr:high-affinity iron transporter [Candidatus Woesearchaeota archaeon]|tara:strand:+ start:222 stop:1073 length:852 start_codon:yes stop_codon:yes gene_type:complete